MNKLYLLLLPLVLLFSCVDDELAFVVEASPVKAEIVQLADAPQGSVSFGGTFTTLDKDGILNNQVGIVATPVADLELTIYSQTQDFLETVMTDAAGEVILTLPTTALEGVTRLEWSGTYDGKAFRILTNL